MKAKRFLLLIPILLLITLGCRNCNGKQDKESYFLVYTKNNSSQLFGRYSIDGSTWNNANIPVNATNGINYFGSCAITDNDGVMHIVMFNNTNNRIEFLWGLGPTIWDTRPSSVTSKPFSSAPSASYFGDNKWLVAYRLKDNTISVSLYDASNSERRFIGDFAPFDNLNSNVAGRPSITILNKKVVMAWRRNKTDLITIVGNIEANSIRWKSAMQVEIPIIYLNDEHTSYISSGVISNPDITHDHSDFYIGFSRASRTFQNSGDPLHHYKMNLIKSSDGINWSQLTCAAFTLVENSEIQIAGRSDKTILIAAILDRSINNISFAKYQLANNQFTQYSTSETNRIFGAEGAVMKPFELIHVGKPSQ